MNELETLRSLLDLQARRVHALTQLLAGSLRGHRVSVGDAVGEITGISEDGEVLVRTGIESPVKLPLESLRVVH